MAFRALHDHPVDTGCIDFQDDASRELIIAKDDGKLSDYIKDNCKSLDRITVPTIKHATNNHNKKSM